MARVDTTVRQGPVQPLPGHTGLKRFSAHRFCRRRRPGTGRRGNRGFVVTLGRVIDSHLHVVDFLQHPIEPGAVTSALAAEDVERLVVFGVPVKKKWGMTEPERPTYYLDDNAPCATYSLTDQLVAELVLAPDPRSRERVAPLICGFDPTDQLAADHVDLMTSRHDVWRGIGEIFLRHDDLTELTYGENARAGHPALDGILEICAARGWPLTFHQDASSAGRSGQREYVGEVVAMLGRHPDVPQVWAHAGVSRRVRPGQHAALLGELMDRHANLHVDLSWVLFDSVVVEGEATTSWVELVARRPDRFVVGSDAFGSVAEQPESLVRWRALTDRLTPAARRMVEHDNAVRLWW